MSPSSSFRWGPARPATSASRATSPAGSAPATVGSAGSGSKRNWVADADSVGSEIARHHRAERRQREAAAPGVVVVPASHRAALLEGLRRVLLSSRLKPDPTRYWADKGTGGPFPFPEQLSEMRRELGVERAPSV